MERRRRRPSVQEEIDAIRVAVRVRPFSKRELNLGAKCIIEMQDETMVVTDPTVHTYFTEGITQVSEEELSVWRSKFHFDRCFWSFDQNKGASQKDVFDSYGPWIIENAVNGYNCSLFAYGQTGSGKTYTMMGQDVDIGDSGQAGFIPRLCNRLFEDIRKAEACSNDSFHVEASYFEIYNERVFDLLNQKSHHTSLRVREHPKTGAYVEDLLTLAVNSYSEIEELLNQGATARRVAETQMNQCSSRSHAVFQLLLRSEKVHPDGKKMEQKSRLYLVDLAGSERVSSSGATGARLKEAANINKSLSALSDVIKALTTRPADCTDLSAKAPSKFVPYRNSSLTWLLKESLGGNAKTVMLATVSPDAVNYQETLSTLKYAERAKKIVNKARVNKESNAALVETLQMEIFELRQQLARYESSGPGSQAESSKQETRNRLLKRLESQEKLVTTLSASWEEKREMTQSHFHSLHEQNQRLQQEKDAMEREVRKLKSEKEQLESREAEEEKRRQERQLRHKQQLENQLRKRRQDQSKQQDLQRQLESAERRIMELEELVEAALDLRLELENVASLERKRSEDQQEEFFKVIERERLQLVRRNTQILSLYQTTQNVIFQNDDLKAKAEKLGLSQSCTSDEEEKVDMRIEDLGRCSDSDKKLRKRLDILEGLPKASKESEKLDFIIQALQLLLPSAESPPSSVQPNVDKQLANLKTKYESATKRLAAVITEKEKLEQAVESMSSNLEVLESKHAGLATFEGILASQGLDFDQFLAKVELEHSRGPAFLSNLISCQDLGLLEQSAKAAALKADTLEARLEEAQSALEEARTKQKSLASRHTETMEKLENAMHTIATLEQEKEMESSDLQRKLRQATTKGESLQQQLEQLQEALEKTQEENKSTKTALSQALEKNESQVSSIRNDAAFKAAQVEAQLADVKGELLSERQSGENLKQELATCKKRIRALEQQLKDVEFDKEMETTQCDKLKEDLQSAKQELVLLRPLKDRAEALESEKESLTEKIQAMELEVESQRKQHMRLTSRYESLVASSEEKEGTLSSRLEFLEEKLRKVSEELEMARSNVKEAEGQLELLKGSREYAETTADKLKQELLLCRQDLQSKEEAVQAAERKLHETEQSSAQQCKTLRDELRVLEDENISLQDRLEEMHKSFQVMKDHYKESSSLVEEMKDELTSMQDDRDRVVAMSQELQAQLQDARTLADKHQQASRTAQAKVEELRAQLSELEEAQVERDSFCKELELQISVLSENKNVEMHELKMKLSNAYSQLETAMSQNKTMEETTALMRAQYQKEKERLKELMDQVEQEKAKAFEDLKEKFAECEKLKYSEMEAVKAKAKLEIELLAVNDQLELARERERSAQERIETVGHEEAHRVVRLTEQLKEEQERRLKEVGALQKKLEEAQKEIHNLDQQVQNERVAFDQIFKAQAEVLSYSQFPRDGKRSSAAARAAPLTSRHSPTPMTMMDSSMGHQRVHSQGSVSSSESSGRQSMGHGGKEQVSNHHHHTHHTSGNNRSSTSGRRRQSSPPTSPFR